MGSDVTLLAFVPRLDSEPACSLLTIPNQCVLSSITSYSTKIVRERQGCVIKNHWQDKAGRQYSLITAFSTFISIWLIAVASQLINAGFLSLADIPFQGLFNVKCSVVIIPSSNALVESLLLRH